MFLSARDLAVRKMPLRVRYAPGELDLLDASLRIAEPIEVVGEAELGAGDEIRVRGRVAGALEGPCDRCAEFVKIPVSTDFELRYEPSANEPEEPEHGISAREADTGFYEGDGIELSDVVREQLLLLLPMRLLCGTECRGICPECGQNRNKAECRCETRRTDPRWDALGKLAGR
jgi:uncharacterized protein